MYVALGLIIIGALLSLQRFDTELMPFGTEERLCCFLPPHA